MDKKKPIADIRLFFSDIANVVGNSLPSMLVDRQLAVETTRIVMKLREAAFSLGEFDHLYINYTTCTVPGDIAPAERVDKVYRFYRYYDVHVPMKMPEILKEPDGRKKAVDLLRQTLLRYFSPDQKTVSLIKESIDCALTEGSQMQMLYKEKHGTQYHALLFLRYTDEAKYRPVLYVTDCDGALVKKQDLPEMTELSLLGEIQVSRKKVTIKPRKCFYNKGIDPIVIEL